VRKSCVPYFRFPSESLVMAGMSPCSGMQWCWPFFSSLVGHCFVRGIDALHLLSKL
jgi:hypothetical protein